MSICNIYRMFEIPKVYKMRRAFLGIWATPAQKEEMKQHYARAKINPKKAFVGDMEVKLSIKEFDIMRYFVDHQGEVIHRHDLLDEVWGYDVMPTTRTVDNFILDLRKKLEANPSNPKHIISIRGIGYKFVD